MTLDHGGLDQSRSNIKFAPIRQPQYRLNGQPLERLPGAQLRQRPKILTVCSIRVEGKQDGHRSPATPPTEWGRANVGWRGSAWQAGARTAAV
jgi:hypothetical protein